MRRVARRFLYGHALLPQRAVERRHLRGRAQHDVAVAIEAALEEGG
jgi:hypothetical protein